MIENQGFGKAGRKEVCRQVGAAGRAQTPRPAQGHQLYMKGIIGTKHIPE